MDEAGAGAGGSYGEDAAETIRELIRLESLLLDPLVRRDREAVAALLTDDFREVGSSGSVYDKALMLDLLAAGETGPPLRATNFEVVFLGPDAALLTYRSGRGEVVALRSSVWVRRTPGGKASGSALWQMFFHQGTRCP